MENIKVLFEYACSGDIKALKSHFDNNGKINVRYNKFNHDNSLIMGAFRNQQYDTVDYLLSVGETLTAEERMEVYSECRRIKTLFKLYNTF